MQLSYSSDISLCVFVSLCLCVCVCMCVCVCVCVCVRMWSFEYSVSRPIKEWRSSTKRWVTKVNHYLYLLFLFISIYRFLYLYLYLYCALLWYITLCDSIRHDDLSTTLSCPTLPYPVLSCPVLSCPDSFVSRPAPLSSFQFYYCPISLLSLSVWPLQP